MNRLLALILYCTAAHSSQVVVQSHTLTDLYGQRLIDSVSGRNVVYLNNGIRPKDAEIVISGHMRKRNYDSALVLGCMLNLPNSSHHPILSQISIKAHMFDGPVYVVSSKDRIAKLRLEQIKKQLHVEDREIETEYELRTAIQSLAESPQGFIILNVFNYYDSWGQALTYKDAEQVLTETNKTHIDVGICYDGFKTAIALGPSIDEVSTLLDGVSTSSMCASLARLKKLGKLSYYLQHMGGFNHVVSPNY